MAGYLGASPAPQAVQRKQTFTATASQTTFTTTGYTDGAFINVYLNGVRLINGTDYTATNGSDIVLTTGASASDVLDFETLNEVTLVNGTIEFNDGTSSAPSITNYGDTNTGIYFPASDKIGFVEGGSEVARIAGNGFLINKTVFDSIDGDYEGIEFKNNNQVKFTRDSASALIVRRNTDDGDVIRISKDGTTVGSIGAKSGDLIIGTTDVGVRFSDGSNEIYPFNVDTLAAVDDATTLGNAAARFKDLYLSGGAYLGGTGAANYLDDYETGTWTVELTIGGSSTGITYSSRSAAYVKIGELVFIEGDIQLSSKGTSTGVVSIENLPFNVDDRTSGTSLDGGAGLCAFQSNTSGVYSPIGLIGQGGLDYISMRVATTSGGSISNNLLNTNITDSFSIRFSLTYRAA